MTFCKTFSVIVFLFLASIAGSQAAASLPSNDVIVATVADVPVHQSEFESYVQGGWTTAGASEIRTNYSARQEALETFLDLKVMAAKARKDGIDKNPSFRKAIELMDMKLLVQALSERIRVEFTNVAAPTSQEIRAYYDAHPDQFKITPSFTFRQVLVYVKGNPAFPDKGLDDAAAKIKAREALAKLRAGESWQNVAKDYSDDTTGSQRGGLMRDAQFGYFPPEIESAIRSQEVGKPGDVVKSQFGYHVLQVEQRTLEGELEPFEKVKEMISSRLTEERISAVRNSYMTALRTEVGLKLTPLATNDAPLQLTPTGDAEGELASIGPLVIRESDFEWFLKDAFRPEQRVYVFNRPGARLQLVNSYLDMRVMEAKARKDGLDQQPGYKNSRSVMEMKLLAEFLQERDRVVPWMLPGETDVERQNAFKKYLEKLRSEMRLKLAPATPTRE